MKKIVPLLFIISCAVSVKAQITVATIKAAFGVEGDWVKGFYNGSSSSVSTPVNGVSTGNDDWFYRAGGSGYFMIDTTGAGARVARYTTDIEYRKTPFFATMRYPAFDTSLVGRTLIDAVFLRDYHLLDSTTYANGSSKNGDSPGDWSCPDYSNVTDKDDILDMAIHLRRFGTTHTASDSLWLFGALSVDNTNGNRYFDFELYQTDIYYDRTSRRFYGYGPSAGHTAWQFDAAGNILQVGDIIFSASYGGSGLSSIEARIWTDENTKDNISPVGFDFSGTFDGSGGVYGYAGIMPKVAGNFYFGAQNSAVTVAGQYAFIEGDNDLATSYLGGQVMEFAVNMTQIGLDGFDLLGSGVCGMPFRRLLVKTRASSSFEAQLKDFVGPFDLFLPPRATAAADVPVFCGTGSAVSHLEVTNPYITSLYTWTTTNGHIVGSTNDTATGYAINVDSPGTYIVSQVLQTGCATFATDTVEVTRNPTCGILANNQVGLKGVLNNSQVDLNWSVTQNQDIKYFTIERSTDGMNFTLAGTVNMHSPETQYAGYQATDNVYQINAPYVYYRIKMTMKNGSVQYSKVIRVTLVQGNTLQLTLLPNPVRDVLTINVSSKTDKAVQLFIYDITGQLVKSINTQVQQGRSTITLTDLRNWARGVYMVKLVSGKEMIVDRLVLTK